MVFLTGHSNQLTQTSLMNLIDTHHCMATSQCGASNFSEVCLWEALKMYDLRVHVGRICAFFDGTTPGHEKVPLSLCVIHP